MSYVIGSKIGWFPSCTGPSTRPGFRSPYLASVSMRFGRGSQERLIWRSFPAYGAFRYESRSGRGADAAEKLLDEAQAILDPIVAPYRIGMEKSDLVEAVAEVLASESHTLAVAESCTGGLMSKRITDLRGSSTYFRGGVIAYADRVKLELLGVEEAVLVENGAVSEAVAAGMACGVADLLNADIGVGITGIAGPGGGTSEKPVGTVWCAVAAQGGVRTSHRVFGGDREAVRERASQMALLLLYRMLADRP